MLVTLPILIPLIAIGACVLCWGRLAAQRVLAVLSTSAVLACAAILLLRVLEEGPQVVEIGGWAAPFGIVLIADLLGAAMVLLASIVGMAVAVYSVGTSDRAVAAHGQAPLMLAMLTAVAGAFLSGDLFNLYVWFELMLLSSFVLLTLGGTKPQLEGAIKYVTLNLLSSVLFLSAIGLIYATTGTLNMAHLALRLDELGDPRLVTALAAPLLVAFAIKAAVFPVYSWLPASYHVAPAPVAALFAGLLTKVGVYAIIRATTLLFDQESGVLADAVLVVAGLTMVSGVLGAVAQNDVRRILSFHIVSQIGYMLMGLGIALSLIGGERPDAETMALAGLAMAGSIFYIVHHIVVKTNLFLIAGEMRRLRGTSDLERLGGLVATNPVLAGLFLLTALSLAGIPVLSGFWAKLALVRAGLEANAYAIVGASLGVSLLTLLSMTKIWTNAFWGEPSTMEKRPGRAPVVIYAPIFALAGVSLAIGLGAPIVFSFAERTAGELLDSSAYIEAVLPTRPGSTP